jgi:hypothetical protein
MSAKNNTARDVSAAAFRRR